MKDLKQILKDKEYLVFVDFEGTQFSHEIIAVGMIKTKINKNQSVTPLDEGMIIYSRSRCPIGKIVTQITGIDEAFLKENGLPFNEVVAKMDNYLQGIELDKCYFVCFGNNDKQMLLESIRYSNPENKDIAQQWLGTFFDYLNYIQRYIKDEHGNNYSLVNYLNLFKETINGESHNPLNDAIDLMHLYNAFLKNFDLVSEEYIQALTHSKYPNQVIKDAVCKLIEGQSVDPDEFKKALIESLK